MIVLAWIAGMLGGLSIGLIVGSRGAFNRGFIAGYCTCGQEVSSGVRKAQHDLNRAADIADAARRIERRN